MTSPPLALAALLSFSLARRSPSRRQWTIAATLAGLLAINAARPLMPWLTVRAALFVAWYAITAICVGVVLNGVVPATETPGQRAVWQYDRILLALALGGSVMTLAAAAAYVGVTAELSRASFAVALVVQVSAVALFIWRAEEPDDAQRVALVLAFSSLVDALPGPWLLGYPVRDWMIGRWISVATWLVIAGWEARCLIRARRPSA